MLKRALSIVTILLGSATFAPAAIITVPGDFLTIQDAVDAASPGDTIEVSVGIYAERVRIEGLDNLSLTGVASGSGSRPIIRPDPTDDGIRVKESSGVAVTGFRIEGGQRGVRLDNATDASITDNEIDTSREGVRLAEGSGHTVSGNTITNVTRGRGVRVDKSSAAVVSGNTVTGAAQEGIRVTRAPGASIADNAVSASARDGIRVVRSETAAVDGNTSSSNLRSGIRVEQSSGATVSNNTADDNGEYGIRVKKSPPTATIADLTGAGNAASGNGLGDFRVDP